MWLGRRVRETYEYFFFFLSFLGAALGVGRQRRRRRRERNEIIKLEFGAAVFLPYCSVCECCFHIRRFENKLKGLAPSVTVQPKLEIYYIWYCVGEYVFFKSMRVRFSSVEHVWLQSWVKESSRSCFACEMSWAADNETPWWVTATAIQIFSNEYFFYAAST